MSHEMEILNTLKYLKNPEKKVDATEWTVREKLALSSAVVETGQEYWPTISRLIQPFGSSYRTDKSWCSSKECAKQYSKILDNISTKKRNENNNSSLSLKDLIVKRLTVERIEELQDDIRREQEKQIALKNMLTELEAGNLDKNIPEIWNHFKEDKDFIKFLAEIDRNPINDPFKLKEPESETTDAMTSSCIEDESDGDHKPRIVLHLKKSNRRSFDSTDSESERCTKSIKLERDEDSDESCDTEPAIDGSEVKTEDVIVPEKSELLVEEPCKIEMKTKMREENASTLSNSPWVKRSKMIINNVLDDPNCHLFDSQTLLKKDDQYNTIVKRILNPVEIRNNLRDNRYSSACEFEHDLMLVLCNAIVYYPIGSPANKIARNIYNVVSPLLECLYEDDNFNTSATPEVVSRRSTRKSILHN